MNKEKLRKSPLYQECAGFWQSPAGKKAIRNSEIKEDEVPNNTAISS